MISGMRICNIRSLRDSGKVPVRKINVLVGMNSSGKSTFLRMFPLLRQSVEVRTKGPLLWYGRLVDFGDFKEAKSSNSGDEPISISFDLTIRRMLSAKPSKLVMSELRTYHLPPVIGVELRIDQHEGDDVGFISSIRLTIASDVVEVYFDSAWVSQIVINGVTHRPAAGQYWFAGRDARLPGVTYLLEKSDEDNETYFVEDQDWLVEAIAQVLHRVAHGNTSMDRLKLVAKQLIYAQARLRPSVLTAYDGARWSAACTDHACKCGVFLSTQ